MGLGTTVKIKVAEIAAKNLAHEAETGKLGALVQRAYLATKGKKTAIGALLTTITLAVAEFTPPWADKYTRIAALVAMGLTALGVLDKARRKEPIFEPWVLETLAAVSAAFAGASGVLFGIAQSGLLEAILPDQPCLSDTVTLWTTAVGSALTFLNRLAKASAAAPVEPPKE
mgnify:FL=1